MNHPEPILEIVLITIAALAIVADVLVRLVIFPNRRDKFVGELLDSLMEPARTAESVPAPEPALVFSADLQEPLLRHFERSSASRQILSKLADSRAMTQRELLAVINQSLAKRGKPPLPSSAARRVAITLLHAGLVGVEHGALRITELGQNLNQLLDERKQAARQLAPSS